MNIKNFLDNLGLVSKQEGTQLVVDCVVCGKPKHLYVDNNTGLWRCVVCDASGNPYQMIKHLRPSLEPKEIFALMDKHGLKDPVRSPAKEKQYSWEPEPTKYSTMTPEQVKVFCGIHKIDQGCFLKLNPVIHGDLVKIPVFIPGKDVACSQVIARYDGKPVQPKKKYMMPKDSEAGFIGLSIITKNPSEPIILCEGWKDALAAMSQGFVATASSGGCGAFKPKWQPVFEDRIVYICYDADKPGVKGADRAAEIIMPVAKETRMVTLPYDVTDDHGKDLHDYIAKDGKQLSHLLFTSVPTPPPLSLPPSRDAIIVDDDHPDTIARSFEDNSSVKHRYNMQDGWTIYSNNKYQRVKDEKEIETYIRRFIANVRIKRKIKQADKTFKEVYVPADKGLKTAPSVVNIRRWLGDLEGIHLTPSQHAPSALNGCGLDPTYMIALNNGLLDWSEYPYKLHPHTPDFYTLNYLPFDWQGEVDSEMWISYLVDVTRGDTELFQLLQMWAGYCLMPRVRIKQRFMLIKGEADTGKSVYADVLTALLGTDNVSSVGLRSFNDPHLIYDTYGKSLNCSDESEEMLLDRAVENNLKQYTGGTKFQFKRMYHDSFSDYPTAKIMIATNHLPRFTDSSEGIWSRMLYAPFSRIFDQTEQKGNLKEDLKRTELPGVLKWALEGARMLKKNNMKFILPKASKVAMDEYRREVQPERIFFAENYEPCNLSDWDAAVKCQDFYDHYKKWCEEHGHKPKSTTRLSPTLKKIFPDHKRWRILNSYQDGYYYLGITAKTMEEITQNDGF